jgi:hypothetical protein
MGEFMKAILIVSAVYGLIVWALCAIAKKREPGVKG